MNIKQLSSDGKIAYLIKPKNKVADIADNEEEMQEEEKSKMISKKNCLRQLLK